jgi:S1/P1 Nuclease
LRLGWKAKYSVLLMSLGVRSLLFSLLAATLFAASTFAWGCKGHQAVALIAERHLTPEAREYLNALLKENPIDPELKRTWGVFAGSLLADGANWPDDIRGLRHNGPWHYIDIPRRAPRQPLDAYCGDAGCVTRAIAEQLAILKNPHADPQLRAEALRYVTHFVGDLHMPLHASDNNDSGGSCTPVEFLGKAPEMRNHSYVPNLHLIWDTSILEHAMNDADSESIAETLERKFQKNFAAWEKAGIDVERWTWESHDLAEALAYGKLRPKDPVENAAQTHSCSDVGERLLRMHFRVDEKYQKASAPVAEKRVAQAGIRLAMILNDAVITAQKAQ